MLCGLFDIYRPFAGTAALIFAMYIYLIYGDYFKLFTQKVVSFRADSFEKPTASQQKESKAFFSELPM